MYYIIITLLTFSAVITLRYSIKSCKNEPRVYIIGYFIFALGVIGELIIKFTRLSPYVGVLWIFTLASILLVGIGSIFLVIGSYIKIKNDSNKKKIFWIMLSTLLSLMGISVTVVLYAYFFMK